ncbi:MAG: hypothetical protein SFY69_05505 [Planctomycetota bacterium]|nr:hypothetical protein [Planctomycetota bacterium]
MSEAPTMRPSPAAWMDAARAWWARGDAGMRDATRGALGLPTDRPVVMSGHQCEFWHPGILAKFFAAQACARALGGCAAWAEVDQDSGAAWDVAYPTRGLERRVWRVGEPEGGPPAEGTPAGCVGALRVTQAAAPGEGVPEFVANGLRAIRAACAAHTGEASLARQVQRARGDLLRGAGLVAPGDPAPTPVWALTLIETPVMREAVEAMRREPGACVAAHNAAAAAHPGARVRALHARGARVELPLWWVRPGAARRRVYADELAGGGVGPGGAGRDGATLAPRALLLTGVLRRAACDLFVHGLGGEKYDLVTEAWLRNWLGWELAPTAVATATRRLALGDRTLPEPSEIQRARAAAHRAAHDPAMVGEAEAGARKRALVAAIRGAGTRAERAGLFRAMHDLLAEVRARRGGEVESLAARARELAGLASRAAVAHDRTWAFPLYPAAVLRELRDAVRAGFGANA